MIHHAAETVATQGCLASKTATNRQLSVGWTLNRNWAETVAPQGTRGSKPFHFVN